ncbi:acyl-CoA dehydrogenase family protein [Diaminobutyricimonas sp. TR449]|uniref:acyl-CoA dehydrogenase family protein n=1 Tax=Diaminobutyricimonas sp. TR449 TaxID=2708076 RepID=UPI001420A686|nr:acyl-CoA dehydrogenase family protein [Diaminobutyricimonas sp. TR449]
MSITRFDEPAAAEFRADVAAWVRDALPKKWQTSRASLTPDEVQQAQREWDAALHAAGYAGLSWPAEYGGRGFGPIEELIYYEESSRANAPDGFGRIGRVLAGPTIIAAGTEAQKAKYLPRILDASEIWCQGFSEPGAGSDLASVTTTAKKVDGGYLINGQKIWTSFAQYSNRCLMLAKSSAELPRHHNLSFLLLDMEQEGVDVRPIAQINGEEEFSEVFFTDVFVADEDLVGEEHEGWRVAMTVLSNERGTTEAATRLVEATAQIDLLNRCCASSSGLDAARLDDRRELLRWHIVRATEEKAAELDWFQAGSILKVQWSELIQDSTRLGLDSGCSVHRDYWRHHYLASKAMSIYSGTNEIQRNIITDRVLKVAR